MRDLPKSRGEAKASGSVSYFTGKSCKNGHVDERFTINGGCRSCQEERRQIAKFEDIERWKASQRDYRERNKEKERDRQRKWAAENREKVNLRAARYYERHTEKCRERVSMWRERNPFLTRAQKTRRKDRLKSGGRHTASDLQDLFRLQRGKCAACRVKLSDYHVDHVIPLAKGGTNDRRNLQLLCPPCNRHKAAKDPIDFMQSKGLLL